MSDVGNVAYLLNGAVKLLAVGEGEIKGRLLCAYTQKVAYIRDGELPEPLNSLLASVHKRLNRTPTYKGQSTTEAALYRMHRKTAARIAADIIELQRGVQGIDAA